MTKRGVWRDYMKKTILVVLIAIFLVGCQPTVTEPAPETDSKIRTPTPVGEVVMDQEIPLTSLPYEHTFTGEEGIRYQFEFATATPVRVVVYNEPNRNEWKQSNTHTLSKMTTKNPDGCCNTKGTYVFDVNAGEGGTYYIVVDDSDLSLGDERPASITVKLTKLVAI